MTTVQRIKLLAKQQGRSIAYICKQLGFNSRTYFNDIEKSGREIPTDKLVQIANMLNTSVDYLLGKTDEPSPISNEKAVVPDFAKTAHEKAVIDAYRAQPELQIAVDKLLGVERDGKVYLYTAASSDDKRFDEITEMPTEKWNKIKNAPQTDDDLM